MIENLLTEQNALIVILILSFIFKHKLVVVPEQLTALELRIMTQIKEEYASKEFVGTIRDDIAEIKSQIRLISDHIMNNPEL